MRLHIFLPFNQHSKSCSRELQIISLWGASTAVTHMRSRLPVRWQTLQHPKVANKGGLLCKSVSWLKRLRLSYGMTTGEDTKKKKKKHPLCVVVKFYAAGSIIHLFRTSMREGPQGRNILCRKPGGINFRRWHKNASVNPSDTLSKPEVVFYVGIKGTGNKWEMTCSILALTLQNGVLLAPTQPNTCQYEVFKMMLGSDRVSQQCVWIYEQSWEWIRAAWSVIHNPISAAWRKARWTFQVDYSGWLAAWKL